MLYRRDHETNRQINTTKTRETRKPNHSTIRPKNYQHMEIPTRILLIYHGRKYILRNILKLELNNIRKQKNKKQQK